LSCIIDAEASVGHRHAVRLSKLWRGKPREVRSVWVVFDHGADQIHDPTAQAAVVSLGNSAGQFQAFRRRDELGHALGEAVVLAAVGLVETFEEVGDRRLQQARGVVQLARR
jgi:hypothetical protein